MLVLSPTIRNVTVLLDTNNTPHAVYDLLVTTPTKASTGNKQNLGVPTFRGLTTVKCQNINKLTLKQSKIM